MPQLSLHTPVGDITVFDEDDAIVSLDWGWVPYQAPSSVLNRAREQLEAYFDGELKEFTLPLAPAGTAYRRGVWRALCGIPYGETRSYRDIAVEAGGSARSVGQANGHNPIPLIIPCHRVVAATHVGGYSGGDGLPTKRWLLALENPNQPCFEPFRRTEIRHDKGNPDPHQWRPGSHGMGGRPDTRTRAR